MTRRLDLELVERGVVDSRSAAQRAIAEGRVVVGGVTVARPSLRVGPRTAIRITPGYVSRGGEKLAGALDLLPEVKVDGRRALDAGSATGGFTEVLLGRGAMSVMALDVGTVQLHPRLRSDPRVIVRDRTDLRRVDPEDLGGKFELIVADLSFISLCLVAGALANLAAPGGDLLALVKPQFEVGPKLLGTRGVVRDPALWQQAIDSVSACLLEAGFTVRRVVPSPTTGEHGNQEFFLWCRL